MIANNKEDFLFRLHNELHRIGIDADEDIFSDFEEHFKASANLGISEEETCRKLGDVEEIARNYLDFKSSRINSMVAREVEAERPRVSLTKPGQSVPADISLRNEQETPIREYTPEHNSEEIYPTANGEAAPLPEYTPTHIKAEEIPNSANSTQAQSTSQAANSGSADSSQGANEQTLAGALGAAGKAIASAAVTAGHAVADAFGTDEMKSAGKSMADAVKNAGHAAADAVKTAAEQAKAKHEAQQQDIPRAVNDSTRYSSGDMHGDIPPMTGAPAGSGNGTTFESVKGMKMNPDFGRLFGQILLDVLLWSWLLAMLIGIDISIYTGGAGIIASGFGALFGVGTNFISRIFLTMFLISLGLIVILLGVLLTKGIIAMVKKIVMDHVKVLYNL